MTKKNRSVELPKEVYEKIEKMIEGSEFKSVSDYVLCLLEEMLEDREDEEKVLSKVDEEKIKGRLGALGYM